MADEISEWSTTAGDNTSLGAVSLLENVMTVKSVNNGFRELMAQVATGISANAFAGLPKVRVVATSNLDLSAPGSSIDSVTLANGETFLAAGQTATEENGPYTFNGAAVAATRLASYATFDKIAGQYFSVMEGTVYADTLWRCTSDEGGTLDTDPLVFEEFTIAAYTAASASGAASIKFAEDTDNGTSVTTLQGAASLSGDITLTLPSTAGTLALASQSVWKHIVTDTITSGSPVSSWVATDLSAYRYLRLTFKLKCSVDNAYINLRTSTDNGVSYDATANDYSTVNMIANGTTVTTGNSATETAFTLTGAGNVPPDETVTNTVMFFDFNQADYCQMRSDGFSVDGSGVKTIDLRRAIRVESTARDAIQLTFSSGTFYGQIILEGIEG